MSDELDPVLLRHFAQAREPLADEAFTTQLAQRLGAARRWRVDGRSAQAVLGTIVMGFGAALRALHLQHARFMLLGAAAVTVWVSLF